MRRRDVLVSGAALAGVTIASAATAAPVDAGDAIIATERAFARMSLEKGIKASFQAYAAPEGILFRPGPVRALEVLATDVDTPGLTLDWWPVLNGVSRAADLGFSIGPWMMRNSNSGRARAGYYLTVWRKQADGPWRYVLDGGGARLAGVDVRPKSTPVTRIALTQARATDDPLARTADDGLNVAAARDAATAYAALATPETWFMGSTVEPSPGGAAARAELQRRPPRLTCVRLGGGAAASADLAYTYGSARFAGEGERPALAAHFVRVWQRQADGWRLVVDSLSPENV